VTPIHLRVTAPPEVEVARVDNPLPFVIVPVSVRIGSLRRTAVNADHFTDIAEHIFQSAAETAGLRDSSGNTRTTWLPGLGRYATLVLARAPTLLR
jgi:hypothetical protein